MKKVLLSLVIVGLFALLSGCNIYMLPETEEVTLDNVPETYYVSIRIGDARGSFVTPLTNCRVIVRSNGVVIFDHLPNYGGWVLSGVAVGAYDEINITVWNGSESLGSYTTKPAVEPELFVTEISDFMTNGSYYHLFVQNDYLPSGARVMASGLLKVNN